MNSDSSNQCVAAKLRPIAGIVLHVRSMLYWEKPYHAVLLSSIITLVFMFFWLIDLSVLSSLSILGITLIFLDFFLPILNGFFSQKWIEQNEAQFESFCKSLSMLLSNISKYYNGFCDLKQTSIKTYYSSLLVTLLIVAWITWRVNNLLITYIITLGLALYPGLSKQDSFKDYMAGLTLKIVSFLPKAKSAKEISKKSN